MQHSKLSFELLLRHFSTLRSPPVPSNISNVMIMPPRQLLPWLILYWHHKLLFRSQDHCNTKASLVFLACKSFTQVLLADKGELKGIHYPSKKVVLSLLACLSCSPQNPGDCQVQCSTNVKKSFLQFSSTSSETYFSEKCYLCVSNLLHWTVRRLRMNRPLLRKDLKMLK